MLLFVTGEEDFSSGTSPHDGCRFPTGDPVWGHATWCNSFEISTARTLGRCGATWRNLEIIYDVSLSGPSAPLSSCLRRARAPSQSKAPIFATIAPRSPRWEYVRAKIPQIMLFLYFFCATQVHFSPCPYDYHCAGISVTIETCAPIHFSTRGAPHDLVLSKNRSKVE